MLFILLAVFATPTLCQHNSTDDTIDILAGVTLSSASDSYRAKSSLMCTVDEDFDPMKQYFEYTMPDYNTEGDSMQRTTAKSYWDQFQWTFYFFGQFVGNDQDTIVTLDYMTESGDTVIAAEIDCSTEKWAIWYTDITLGRTLWQEGLFDNTLINCADGEIFDVILKVTQRRLLFFQFNGQLLHDRLVYWKEKTLPKLVNNKKVTIEVKVPTNPLPTTSKYYAYKGVKISFTSSGAAFLDRFAFGQCQAWPKQNSCPENKGWLFARSKGNATEVVESETAVNNTRLNRFLDGVEGQGVFGNNDQKYTLRCISEKYYSWMNSIVHADRALPMYLGSNRYYCCCSDMRTGGVYMDDPEKYCWSRPVCLETQKSCFEAINKDLLTEAIAEAVENGDVEDVFNGIV